MVNNETRIVRAEKLLSRAEKGTKQWDDAKEYLEALKGEPKTKEPLKISMAKTQPKKSNASKGKAKKKKK